MSFPSFRTAAAAATLTALLGLSAVQVNAQPREHRMPVQVETHNLERLWQWLTELWAPVGGLQQMQEKSNWLGGSIETNQAGGPSEARRGMTIDPNG